MNLFQIIFLILVGCLFVASFVAAARGWATRREGLVSAMIWLVSGAAVAWPEVSTRIARVLGLGRGLNLLLYCTVVVMIVGFFMTYIRLRRVQREMTLLVRHLAISEAHNRCDNRQDVP